MAGEGSYVYQRLLTFLRCPECQGPLQLASIRGESTDAGEETSEGLLHCGQDHIFPVIRGVPRLLPDSLDEHWPALEVQIGATDSPRLHALGERVRAGRTPRKGYDRRTRENFSLEWDHHEVGDTTWGMALDDRVRWFFLEPIRMAEEELEGLVMLDAGCGNGSQSVAYTAFGVEVLAVDLSSGLENGQRLRRRLPGARPELVHFIQGDLQTPPLAPSSVDLVHSAGVIHHTSDTEGTFRRLTPLLRPGGTFYVWLYKYEPVVTPVVNSLRAVTTRVPARVFARVAGLSAGAFRIFCRAVSAVGIREYPKLTQREAALALMDIFGAPYAHYHSFDEVAGWYRSEGFDEVWTCNESRRGFGVCGRRSGDQPTRTATEAGSTVPRTADAAQVEAP